MGASANPTNAAPDGRYLFGTLADTVASRAKTTVIGGVEYSLTKEWVLALDVERDEWGRTRVTGRDGAGPLTTRVSPRKASSAERWAWRSVD